MMGFRDITLPEGAVVRARVGDEAIADWLRDRDLLRAKGYPDRPPDFDDGPTRSWVPHVDSETPETPMWRDTIRLTERPDHAIEERGVVAYTWSMGAIGTKLIVSERADGSFRIKQYDEVTADGVGLPLGALLRHEEMLVKADADPDATGLLVENLVVLADELAAVIAGQPIEPTVHISAGEEEAAGWRDWRLDVIAEFGWAEWAEPFLGPKP